MKKRNNDGQDSHELHIFSFETISAATRNFSTKNKLGEGGFGPVYKVFSLSLSLSLSLYIYIYIYVCVCVCVCACVWYTKLCWFDWIELFEFVLSRWVMSRILDLYKVDLGFLEPRLQLNHFGVSKYMWLVLFSSCYTWYQRN